MFSYYWMEKKKEKNLSKPKNQLLQQKHVPRALKISPSSQLLSDIEASDRGVERKGLEPGCVEHWGQSLWRWQHLPSCIKTGEDLCGALYFWSL